MLLEWWDRYRRILLPVAAVLVVASSLWLYQVRGTERESTSGQLPLFPPAYAAADGALASDGEDLSADGTADAKNTSVAAQEKVAQPAEPSVSPLYVDVKGSVREPGLYRLEAGMRVADAIAKAGGTKPEADLDQLNLAALLVDGTAVVIPAKGSAPQPFPASASPASSAGVSSSPYAANRSGGTASHGGDIGPLPGQPVLLNTATREELMTLPGIGEARARAILQYREEKGGFRSPEELQNIEGIGEKLYGRIKDRIRVR